MASHCQAEKVYVAIGTDLKEGYATLGWALRKWASHSISIVILHVADKTTSKEYVYTPVGKLPASYVSDEKLDVFRRIKEEENDQLLSEYTALCGKVKVEILKLEKTDEPLHKQIVELISKHRITKLVVGITFLKHSWSGKSRGGISGSFYVHRHKPEFCELFIICGGKLVFLREENNEGYIEDDQGVMVAKYKEKGSFRGWLGPLGKMLPESGDRNNLYNSPSSSSSTCNNPDQWENNVQEIEIYFNQLLSLNSDEEGSEVENENLGNGQPEPNIPENMSAADKIAKIRKAHETIQLNKKEAKANVARRDRAEWAVCLCTRRVEELEARINEEMVTKIDLKKELDATNEEIYEVRTEVEDKKSKLKSTLELQGELSNRLQLSSLAKSRAEVQLEKAVANRAEMVQEIEQWRRQRDVLQRRIEFCKEKDAIGMATRLSDLGFSYKEFMAEEIKAATDDFSEHLRLKSAGEWTNVYRGRISHITVAIKMCDSSGNGLSPEAFQAKVKLLSQLRHPQLVAVIGFCTELKCIVFEYMHNGCLRDALFSVRRSSRRIRNQGLNWQARVRIASEVCSGLGFLHSAQPRPIAHGNLNPSKILLDRNLGAKIHGFRPGWCHDQVDVQSDIRAFGNLVMQLLTGRNWVGLIEEAIVMDKAALLGVLDDLAGEWPLDMAMELSSLALRCVSVTNGPGPELSMAMVKREIDKVRKMAEYAVETGESDPTVGESAGMEDLIDVPRVFLCPIYKEAMKNPHLAADGFSYELEAIEEWLSTGHDTSPMTNLKLKHKLLTPNHTLRSLIQDWHNKRSIILEHV